ncbi:16650_t:CDS:2, partial [Cetraspora pellucida]
MAKLKRIQQENYSKEISLSIKKSKITLEQALMDIIIRENINSDLRNYILSNEFWKNLNLLSTILEPIVVTLKQLESDNSTLSSIYFYFKKEYTYHSIRIVAYMLDSQFLETNNLLEEAMRYSEFTTFTKEKFDQDKSVNLFIGKYDTRTNQETNCNNSDNDELFDNGFEMN